MDEEGGLNDPNYKYWSSERYSNETLKIADISFCWGKYDYENNFLEIYLQKIKSSNIYGNSNNNRGT